MRVFTPPVLSTLENVYELIIICFPHCPLCVFHPRYTVCLHLFRPGVYVCLALPTCPILSLGVYFLVYFWPVYVLSLVIIIGSLRPSKMNQGFVAAMKKDSPFP